MSHRSLSLQLLEIRLYLSTVSFFTENAVQPIIADVSDVDFGDFDNDGDPDAVLSHDRGKLVWLENIGNADLSVQHSIENEIEAEKVKSVDLDDDGWLDILTASRSEVVWQRNLRNGTFSKTQFIARQLPGVRNIEAADLDGDGDQDVITSPEDRDVPELVWFENLNDADEFGPIRLIANNEIRINKIHSLDVDADGDLDLVTSSAVRNLAWHENTDGLGNFGERHLFDVAEQVVLGDLDGDGDSDLVTSGIDSDFTIQIDWIKNDGAGNFSKRMKIGADVENPVPIDVDHDGDLDLIARSTSHIVWFENLDGFATFGEKTPLIRFWNNGNNLAAFDLDGDEHEDIISIHRNKVVSFRNLSGASDWGHEQWIAGIEGVFREAPVDVDGDGDFDIVAAGREEFGDPSIVWYPFHQETNSFGARRLLQSDVDARGFQAIDFDLDGDMDVAVILTQSIGIMENVGGEHNFKEVRDVGIRAHAFPPTETFAWSDINGDGYLDVIPGNPTDFVWYQNLGDRFVQQPIATQIFPNLFPVLTADMDLDGDLDIVTNDLKRLLIHENLDGRGGSFETHALARLNGLARIESFAIADLNSDGTPDLVTVDSRQAQTIFLPQIEGQFTDEIIVASGDLNLASIALLDFDNDGDIDIVDDSERDRIVWLENHEGDFTRRQSVAIDRIEGVPSYFIDFNQDGLLDVLAGKPGASFVWFTHHHQSIGDVNNDGVFNSSDLVRIFQQGEYEDGIQDNSTFTDGDWNGDREFDSSDLVLAFQSGNFVATVSKMHEIFTSLVSDKKLKQNLLQFEFV